MSVLRRGFRGLLFFAMALSGCSMGPEKESGQGFLPQITGPAVDVTSVPEGGAIPVTLSNGAEIVLQNFGGKLFLPVEGTFESEAYSKLLANIANKTAPEKKAILGNKIKTIFSKINAHGGFAFTQVEELGYFTFFLPYDEQVTTTLKNLGLNTREILLNPIDQKSAALKEAKSFGPRAFELEPQASLNPRESNDAFSGLGRMRVLEFREQAEKDIGGGAQVDGSSVKLGITDTGITYNHSTFLSQNNKGFNRISFIGDFTREGRVYFHPQAKFEVKVPENGGETDLLIEAEVILTPRLPAIPEGDKLTPVKGLRIKVTPALRKILLTPESGAKLGVLLEASLQSEDSPIDLNANGLPVDRFFMILVPGVKAGEEVIYVDVSGTGDFRQAKPLGDWNRTHDVVRFAAEKVGFSIKEDQLPIKGKDPIQVQSASLVGFDPGNHGTHVAGIAAGSQTMLNDVKNTLARGVAPEASILMERVCANGGGCRATEGLIELVTQEGAEVVNMSLGGLSPFNDGYGVQETIINRLTHSHNALFMISAGNSGPGRQTVGSPSVARFALSIGATANKAQIQKQYQWPGGGHPVLDHVENDFLFFFSSRGPTAAGGFKPNIVAPGSALSSVRLNAAPGDRAGMDVYWGTSMSAPAATGAFALLLDAIKKFNGTHSDQSLTTNVVTLRQVLMESARAFDVNSFDTERGIKTDGQYTWIDQGKGMVDLLAAWKKLFEIRDRSLPTAVNLNGKPVELDYQVIVSTTGPNGIAYDGSRAVEGTPAFGTGLYLDFKGIETLRPIFIARRIPENLASGADAGELDEQLKQTQDVFVLKTVIYGSGKPWIKAGVLSQLNCADSPVGPLSVQGRGVEIKVNENGTGSVVPYLESTLFVCLDREMIARGLTPGDHGALISAYRKVGNQEAATPSFMIPVYVTVPHKTLNDSAAYEVKNSVESFGVSRNYISVPKGTSIVKLILEVPLPKLTSDGRLAPGETCSSVELLALEASNSVSPIQARKDGRVTNCSANGSPLTDEKLRKLSVVRTNPTPGVWDLHVFGMFKFPKSQYTLRVDYVTGETSVKKIAGSIPALTGSLTWTAKESSLPIFPDKEKSGFVLDGLSASTEAQVEKDQKIFVEGPLGVLRSYPPETRSVIVSTGSSEGNDLDLAVFECNAGVASPDDPSCELGEMSAGPTDEEQVTFQPQKGKVYAVRVEGFEVSHQEGRFTVGETIGFGPERGAIDVSGAAPKYSVAYTVGAEAIAKSKLIGSALFQEGRYHLVGSMTLRTSDWMNLTTIPVEIKKEAM